MYIDSNHRIRVPENKPTIVELIILLKWIAETRNHPYTSDEKDKVWDIMEKSLIREIGSLE